MSRRGRNLVLATWLVGLAGLGTWVLSSGTSPGAAARDLVDAIEGSPWGPAVYVGAYLVRPLVLFPATVITVAGGFLFGAVAGTALVIVAGNASAMIAYAVGRWLRGGPGEGEGTGVPARMAARARERGFQTVALMRLLFLPFDLVSYACGALRVRPVAFLAATAIAGAPATVGFVLLGASLESFDGGVPRLDPWVLGFGVALIVAAIGLAEVLRRRERTRAA